jgi:predicted TIM-barrel fold metal-dependent hydrolase
MHDLELQKILLSTHANKIKAFPGWTMAFTQLHPEFWSALRPVIETEVAANKIRLITDHFALLKGRSLLPAEFHDSIHLQPGFAAIISLVRDGLLWIKLSAPYRVSRMSPGYEDMEPVVRALVSANPHRILWGSDWPHTPQMRVRSQEEALKEAPNLDIDDMAWLKSLRRWLSDAEWDLMMRVNPTELYDW